MPSSISIEMEKEIERLNQQLAERTDYETESYQNLIDRVTHLTEHFQMMGGNNYHAELERTLIGLGFSREDFDRPTSEFSGGWRMRIELAKLLLRKPDVLLLDIQMPNGSGLDAGEQILQQDPNARILFLTTFSDDAYIAKALELGAKGYLLKQDFAGIVPALEAVMQGQHVFGEQVVSCFSKQFKKKSTFDYAKYDITEKEQEIIAQVAKGYSNKEIAAALCFSEGTIRNYLSSILEKLQLRDRTQLAVYYYHHQMDV